MGWRQDAYDRLEAMCGLNPQAIGLGSGPIVGPDWWVFHHQKESTMHFCRATIALGEDMRNTIVRDEYSPVSWPEIEVLRAIHGDASVTEVIPFVRVPMTGRAERQRLSEIYGEEACAVVWGGKSAPSELEAPEATIRPGIAWMNPVSQEIEITTKDGSTPRPPEPAPTSVPSVPVVETFGDPRVGTLDILEPIIDEFEQEQPKAKKR